MAASGISITLLQIEPFDLAVRFETGNEISTSLESILAYIRNLIVLKKIINEVITWEKATHVLPATDATEIVPIVY